LSTNNVGRGFRLRLSTDNVERGFLFLLSETTSMIRVSMD
jgi:hypothetical protein